MVVVAIVATVYTAGAAGAALGAASSATATTASAIAASAGGYGALGVSVLAGSAAISTGALIGGAVIGGLVGAAASQMAGKAMGVVDSFSWGQVAVGGLTAGITAGFGYLAQAGQLGAWGKTAAIAMKDGGSYGSGYAALGTFNYANSQIASRIVGLDTSFSWRNVAASAVGATIGGAIGAGAGLTSSVIRDEVGAFASAVIKDKWLGGGRPDYGQVATDAFGNILADYMINNMASSANSAESPDRVGSVREQAAQRLSLEGYSTEQVGAMLDSGYLPPPQTIAIGDTDDGRKGFFYDSGAISVSAPSESALMIGDSISSADGSSERPLYQRILGWSQEERAADRQFYNEVEYNAGNPGTAIAASIGRALNSAGYDFVDGAAGIMGLVTDGNLRTLAFKGAKNAASNIWNNPGDAVNKAYTATGNYYDEHSVQQMGEDALGLGAGLLTGAGVGKTAGMLAKAGMTFYENSVFIPLPRATVLNGGINVAQGLNFVRITTVTKAMSERFQGMGYIDPRSNKITAASVGKTMAVDHIYPVSKITKLPGFDRLTKEQMTSIIQDKIELGNLQPLPQSLNSSKGSSISWRMYREKPLKQAYIDNLIDTQGVLKIKIQNQIRAYEKINLGM
ncbi:hypothetical protein HX882_07755 [Pseudomonas gingeri]|uniref:Uncharacterized protein n=1 Tax=Pseudomonas gingeri TaxID=117681 RepID=A0A7Y8C201_9PSED|nr:hypothetical protein [Pseudomonas gingeri]NWB95777.1 hypothetical protein [Pseudomonas gingeri]